MPSRMGNAFELYLILHGTWRKVVTKKFRTEDPENLISLLASGLDGKGSSQQVLAMRLRLRQSQLSKLIKKLEASNLVRRQRNPEKYREVLTVTTQQGRDLLVRLRAEFRPFDLWLKPT